MQRVLRNGEGVRLLRTHEVGVVRDERIDENGAILVFISVGHKTMRYRYDELVPLNDGGEELRARMVKTVRQLLDVFDDAGSIYVCDLADEYAPKIVDAMLRVQREEQRAGI